VENRKAVVKENQEKRNEGLKRLLSRSQTHHKRMRAGKGYILKFKKMKCNGWRVVMSEGCIIHKACRKG